MNFERSYIDISVVVNAHAEGRLLHRSLRSVQRARRHAEVAGISSELIIVLDRPDQATSNYVSKFANHAVIAPTNFGDLALARNRGVEAAAGRFVAFLDGDDLMGQTWLTAAFQQASREHADCIHYPEWVVQFEGLDLFLHPRGTRDPLFRKTDLLEHNCWNSAHFFAPRRLLQHHRFVPTPIAAGFGYEDWHWYSEVIASGTDILIVPETCMFYRKKVRGSLLQATETASAVVPASTLFEPKRFAQLYADELQAEAVRETITLESTRVQLARTSRKLRLKPFARWGYQHVGPQLRPILARTPWLRKRAQRVVAQFRTPAPARREFPEWLLRQWRAMHDIEPSIFPEQMLLNSIVEYHVPRSVLAGSYVDLCRRYGTGVSHLVLVPWLKAGGSDLETINYVRALVQEGLADGVVVMATENAESPWADRLPVGVRFINFGKLYGSLWSEYQEQLLVRTWLQMRPPVVHILNSDLAYRVLRRHGRALRNASSVFVSVFCPDTTPEGKNVGYAFDYLPDCFDHVDGVFADNQAFLDTLTRTYAFDPSRLHVHYQPMQLPPRTAVASTRRRRLEVLWAGRLDRQKRPDLLLAIAAASASLPIRFHVYGSSLIDNDAHSNELRRRSNIEYHGPFNGFAEIPAHAYDVFLHTAQWEGLPNILMEAMASGLVVIATNVGGVPELIRDGETGFLIDPYDDVDQYVCRLEALTHSQTAIPTLVENARALLAERHSWHRFVATLRAETAYALQSTPAESPRLRAELALGRA